MSKPSPSFFSNSLSTQNQLVDSLTAHISFYHLHSSSSNPNHQPQQPRSVILKWFSSLTVHQRQSHLTAVDHNFVQLLIQMLGKLRAHGHGRFIILPDLPSRGLPGLCFKKSRGLLSRVAESNDSERSIFESTRLFDSREGENVRECTCSVNCLDSITVGEEVVENVDKFVEMMDTVSNGEFLRGEESKLGSDWVELEWLKARGYYSIEAFVANRLEVALRLAWMNSTSGKKRGVKLKEKLAAAGTAANVFWRKKGCVDWWRNLDPRTRRNFMTTALGKSARSLTCEILEDRSRALEEEMWLFRAGAEQPIRYIYAGSSRHASMKLSDNVEFGSAVMPTSLSGKPLSLATVFNCLSVLQDIVTVLLPGQHSEYDISKAFFSTLGSVNTFSDCIFRKLRGLVMAISLDCTKLELLEEGNFKPNKPKEKLTAGSRRKKGKTHNVKKLNMSPLTGASGSSFEKSVKDLDCAMAHSDKAASNEVPVMPHGNQVQEDISSTTVDEHSQGLVLGKGRSAARKGRRGKNKKQKSSINNPVEVRDSQGSVGESPCLSASALDKLAMCEGLGANECIKNDVVAKVVQEDLDVQGMCQRTLEYCESADSLAENQTTPSGPETLDCKIQCNGVSHVVSPTKPDAFSSNKDMNSQNKKIEAKQCFTEKTIETVKLMKDIALIHGQESKSLGDFGSISPLEPLSYEWPSLAPVYFPSINSHLPPATDRLHLDVGHSWHNHIRQPFVPTVRQARNPVIESGCSRMLSRPLAMSLDWPPVVRSTYGLAPTVTCNYDSGFISRRQATFQQNFVSQNMQFNAKSNDDDRIYSGDFIDLPEAINTQEVMDECESHWISEEEFDVHAVSGRDYNQYFGGGVMYWNPSDHLGAGFSRPPSLSSDDSSWAWREADMNRAVDDMVAFSSSYSTNGLTSPTAASFCSPLDPLGPGHQALGYVVSGNEVAGKVQHSSPTVTESAADEETTGSLASLSGDVEGKASDSLPYPILRPIIIPSISRERRVHDRKSPCVPPTRREQQRIKRPPSPVVLCVPRAPRPPPPSPVSDSRRHRGFPTVRSGSSSPRHWGMRGWYQEGTNLEDGCVRIDGAEVVWPSWRNNNLSTHPMIQPLPGALLQDRLIAISQLSRDQEHPDVSFPLQPPEPQNCPTRKASLLKMHSLLHDEIDFFGKQVAAANMARKPFINWAVKRVTRSLQVLWPRSRTNIFGSNATGLSLPSSDVDLVVCLPPVRNLEPIKEAGILEGRNGIKETCLQHAARYLANQDWVKNDSLKTVENTAIPIIMLVVEVPSDLIASSASNVQSPKEDPIQMAGEHDNHVQSDIIGVEDSSSPKSSLENFDCRKDVQSVRLDISFKSPSHTGLQTTELVKELTEQFPAATPLALVLKQFLADRSLDQSYSGGLSSYCLVILITRFLQHEHHLGRPINQVMNLGCLLMDFLYFFGNVFDPRQMRISVQGSGVYINRERGYSIDPIHIDDPLFPTNNVGRNCFRIHQCIKAFSEAYSILENELICLQEECDTSSRPPYRLLPKIVPSINLLLGN